MRNRKKDPDTRLADVEAQSDSAVEIFHSIADDLETAAHEADVVLQEAEDEVVRLRLVRDRAYAARSKSLARAAQIRELVS